MADPVVSPISKRNYGSRLTLDLDASYPDTKPEDCDVLKNVIRVNDRSFAKRPGAKILLGREACDANVDVWVGFHNYAFESGDGTGISERLYLVSGGSASKPARLWTPQSQSISIDYGGAGTSASISVLANGSNAWVVTLYVDGVAVSGWPKSYGDGVDTSLPRWSIDHLVADIDAEADWTCTGFSTDARVSVAQLGSLEESLVLAASPDLTLRPQTVVTEKPTTGYYQGELGSNFANLKGATSNDCMFFPLGRDASIIKYDGFSRKPGLPRATITAIADTGAGATHAAGNVYIYRVVFWRVDRKSNQIYGPYSDDALAVATHTVGGVPTNITLSFLPMSKNDSQFLDYDPASATVNGGQVGVTTVTVTAGHNLQALDKVYLLNQATGLFVEKDLTSVTATTITFSGAVNVNNGDVISNIRVQIQRTENGGIDFFEVANVTNNALLAASTSQTYIDAIADTALGSSIEEQAKLPEPPPNCSFMCIHQGLLVLAYLDGDANGFAWNDPEWGIEAFPSATNRDRIKGGAGGITGIISESDLALGIFKRDSYFRIEGDLASGQYTINEISRGGLGIASHASLVKTEMGIVGISEKGPVLIKDGAITLFPQTGIFSKFTGNPYDSDVVGLISDSDYQRLVPKRSTGAYWSTRKLLVFFIPAEGGSYSTPGSGTNITRYANEYSLWLCYDLTKQEWRTFEFDDFGINAHVAMTEFKGELYFISTNEYDGVTLTGISSNYVWKLQSGEDALSYTDNTRPIQYQIRLAFESLGAPDSEKKMTALKVLATNDQDFIDDFTLEINEYRNQDTSVLSRYLHATRTFDGTATSREKIIDPVPGDFVSNSIELKNEVAYECPVISGIAASYKITTSAEMKDQKGSG